VSAHARSPLEVSLRTSEISDSGSPPLKNSITTSWNVLAFRLLAAKRLARRSLFKQLHVHLDTSAL
jgi:hypothetical protein